MRIKLEQHPALTSVEGTKTFVSKQLANIPDQAFASALREMLFQSNIEWKDVQLILSRHMPEVNAECIVNENFYSDHKDELEGVKITSLKPGDLVVVTNGMYDKGIGEIIRVYEDSPSAELSKHGVYKLYCYDAKIIKSLSNSISEGTQYSAVAYSNYVLKLKDKSIIGEAVKAKLTESSDDIDLSEYEYVSYGSGHDRKWQKYRKFDKSLGKGVWVAKHSETGEIKPITYDQAQGFEPIEDSGIARLSRDLGRMLLPNK